MAADDIALNIGDCVLNRRERGERFDAEGFLDGVRNLWPSPPTAPVGPELVSFVEAAVAKFPQSPRLWCRLGDLLKLGAKSSLGVETACECYKKALDLDPLCGEAYEELAFLLDIHEDPRCRLAFELAIRCDGSLESYLALARLYVEEGDVRRAQGQLAIASEYFTKAVERITEMQREISGR